jgi:hypothetical protein
MEAHMKNLWIVLLLCGLGLGILFAQAGSETEKERAAVRAVIDNAYIQAVYVKADATAVAEGWHPGCDIAILSREGILNKVSAYELVRGFKQGHPPFDKNAGIGLSTRTCCFFISSPTAGRSCPRSITAIPRTDAGRLPAQGLHYF